MSHIDIAINLEPLYPGMDFCEKIRRVSRAGFRAIEFWGWNDKDLKKVRETCEELGVKVRAFSGTGQWSLCDREHRSEYLDWIRQSIEAAKQLSCDKLILFPNHFTPDGCADFRDRYSHDDMLANVTATLAQMVPMLEESGMTVLLEPLCNEGADAGMSVTDTEEGAAIVRAVGSDHVRLLCDVYHMQMMHGNLEQNLMNNTDIVPYIHIADAPGRNEPGTGEINFTYLSRKVKTSPFDGTVCFEYFPAGEPEEGYPSLLEMCGWLQ